VVISMLQQLLALAAAGIGFSLNNTMLIIAEAWSVLRRYPSYIMCKAMTAPSSR